jgi:hypothetical protein
VQDTALCDELMIVFCLLLAPQSGNQHISFSLSDSPVRATLQNVKMRAILQKHEFGIQSTHVLIISPG